MTDCLGIPSTPSSQQSASSKQDYVSAPIFFLHIFRIQKIIIFSNLHMKLLKLNEFAPPVKFLTAQG